MPEGQEPAPAPGGQEPQAPPVLPATAQDADAEPFDKDRAMATIAKLREFEKQAKAQADELKTLRAAAKAADDAKLSETERLTKQAQEAKTEAERLTAELRQERARLVILAEAQKAGVNPELALKLVDLPAEGDLTADHAKTALAEWIRDNPGLVVQATANGSATNPARSGAGAHGTLSDGTTKEQAMAELFGGRSGQMWDLDSIRARGGGLRWDPDTNPKQRGPLYPPGTQPD